MLEASIARCTRWRQKCPSNGLEKKFVFKSRGTQMLQLHVISLSHLNLDPRLILHVSIFFSSPPQTTGG